MENFKTFVIFGLSVRFFRMMNKNFVKIGKFWDFFDFGVNLRHFHSKNCNKRFGNAYWKTDSFLADPFRRFNPQSPSKIWKKMQKKLKIGKHFGFLSFSVSI